MRLLHKRETAFKNIAPLRLGLLSKVSFLQTSLPIRSDKPANDPYAELNWLGVEHLCSALDTLGCALFPNPYNGFYSTISLAII